MACSSCIFSEEDWDEVLSRCAKCQYIFENLEEIQKDEKVERFKKNKRIVFERRRNKIYKRNYLRKLYDKITEKIQSNTELNEFVNEMINIFNDVEDVQMLRYIVYTKNIKTLNDLLKINGLYHLKLTKNIADIRLKLMYKGSYEGELFELKWSDKAKYLLRTLVGLTRFGHINNAHIKAIFWHCDESIVKIDIKKLIDNQYIFKEIKSEIMKQFLTFYDKRWSMNNLYRTYDNLGLNFDSIYFRCLNSLIEF
jgi:DNA-directed RNA polymerase subunit M/transcription elongation factor TFIIS